MATSAIGQKFSIGSEVGIISSINTNYNLTDYQNRRNTYYAGININYQVVSSLSFTTGLHYVRQGYRHATCYISEDGEVDWVNLITCPSRFLQTFIYSNRES
ncbi:MAG: hypothetical protein IPP25_14945 [Saprospiraceae bacterium]|nr:hypothetical protein [Candidatus Opimibacter skivensis]